VLKNIKKKDSLENSIYNDETSWYIYLPHLKMLRAMV